MQGRSEPHLHLWAKPPPDCAGQGGFTEAGADGAVIAERKIQRGAPALQLTPGVTAQDRIGASAWRGLWERRQWLAASRLTQSRCVNSGFYGLDQ